VSLTVLVCKPCLAEPRKIGKITYSVSKTISESRRQVFAEHDIGNRLTSAFEEVFRERNLIGKDSNIVLNLSVYVFRLRHAVMAGIFGFLHTGKDRIYLWADLKDKEKIKRLFRIRATNSHGWLFSPSTRERINGMAYRAAEEAVLRYEEYIPNDSF